MLRLLREGLRCYRSVLLGAWAWTTIGLVPVFAALVLAGVVSGHAALTMVAVPWPVSILVASAVAGWIAAGTELTEHRVRMHVVLPVSVDRLALSQLLLPTVMLLFGLALAHAGNAAVHAIWISPTPWLGHAMLNFLGAHLLVLFQLTYAIREVVLLREGARWKHTAGVVVLLLLCAPAWVWVGWPPGGLALRTAMATALTAGLMVFTVALFRLRRQFLK